MLETKLTTLFLDAITLTGVIYQIRKQMKGKNKQYSAEESSYNVKWDWDSIPETCMLSHKRCLMWKSKPWGICTIWMQAKLLVKIWKQQRRNWSGYYNCQVGESMNQGYRF